MTAVLWNILLAFIWMALSGVFTQLNFFIGFALGYVVLGFALKDIPAFRNYRGKVVRLIVFALFFIRELIVSNLRVAYDVITPSHYMRPGVIAYPLQAKTPGEITILANLISLTPGTLSLDVSSDKKVLYIHVMYMQDEAQVMEGLRNFESRLLRILR